MKYAGRLRIGWSGKTIPCEIVTAVSLNFLVQFIGKFSLPEDTQTVVVR